MIDAQGAFTDIMSRGQGGGQPSTILSLTIDFELETRQINGYLAFLLDIPSGEKLLASLGRYIEGA